MEKIELKPCPFCGSSTAPTVMNQNDALWLDDDFDGEDLRMVVCCAAKKSGCGASTGLCETDDEAVEAWNIRASGWIPCSERMPETRQNCLVAFLTLDPSEEKWSSETKFMVLEYLPEEKYWNAKMSMKSLAWMPIPELPGGDDSA